MRQQSASVDNLKAFIFDLDGVVTRTARVHAAAWTRLFEEFLRTYGVRRGRDLGHFSEGDYNRYVDGKPRYDGVRSFLSSRGIDLPYGTPDDPPDRETVCGLGNRKNGYFRQALEDEGVEIYESTVELVNRLKERRIRVAVISASRNCGLVLEKAGLGGFFDARVDGIDSSELKLAGKPAPDIFLEAARRLGVAPEECAVVEDALAGVEAGAAGKFGLVIGVDRSGQADLLEEKGADMVVRDLAEVFDMMTGSIAAELPSALERVEEILAAKKNRRLAVFLDYDGVLTPIVRRPEEAIITAAVRQAVQKLATICTVAIVSGRDLEDVRRMAGIPGIAYAGSHGFEIDSPTGQFELAKGIAHLPALAQAERLLQESLAPIPGTRVERKKFAIAVHYREAAPERVAAVEAAVARAARETTGLRRTGGKKVFELRPDIDWDKGKAVSFLLGKLETAAAPFFPIYLGDDLTDEDAFRELAGKGIGIFVGEERRPTAARYVLRNTGEVQRFLARLTGLIAAGGDGSAG